MISSAFPARISARFTEIIPGVKSLFNRFILTRDKKAFSFTPPARLIKFDNVNLLSNENVPGRNTSPVSVTRFS